MGRRGSAARLAAVFVAAQLACVASEALSGLLESLGPQSSIVQARATGLKPLKLCDCHFRQSGDGDDGGKPEDLTCDAEGYFIAGFERAGVFSGYQSEGFPLSSAICCRPCFGGDDPEFNALSADVAAIISVACEPSVYRGAGQECPGETFMMSYPDSRVGQPIEKYFPIGQAQCCRPSLLYKNGTQRLLRRCDGTVPGACGQPAGGSLVSCDSSDDPAAALALGRLAYGYAHVLKAPGFGVTGGDYIPQAPAECCSVCLDPSEPILALPCEASNFCNGHGHCSTAGRCLCNAGWTGPDCTDRDSDAFLESWLPTPVIIAAIVVCSVCLCVCGLRIVYLQRVVQVTVSEVFRLRARARTAEEVPLLDSDDESEWTEEEEEEEEEEPEGRWGYSALPPNGAAAAAAANPARDVEAGAVDDAPEGSRRGEGEGGEGEHAATAGEASAAPGEEGGAAGGGGEEGAPPAADAEGAGKEAAAAAPPQPRRPREPAIRNECTVCMSARLQVVFLPCGHACTCRACSRRLARCPICRVPIARRQKLYIQSSGLGGP